MPIESNRVTRLFSFTGKSRRICENIKIVTDILEADEMSDVICQKCDRFVESRKSKKYITHPFSQKSYFASKTPRTRKCSYRKF